MRRGAVPTFDQLLDAVPVCNRAVRVERHADSVLLWVPIRRRPWMRGPLAWLLPFRKEKGIALDVVGTEIWSACDGLCRVEDIIERFAERHKLRFHEARVSVSSFLKSLCERNLLVLAVPSASTGEPNPGAPLVGGDTVGEGEPP
jgi:hypothetical protein